MGYERGFTIIEVILFLAITGLLLFSALTSVSGTIDNNRYTDTLKSLQAYLQSQYNEVQTNVSHRDSAGQSCGTSSFDTTPGASDACIVMGRLIDIKASKLDVYTLVGDIEADGGKADTCGLGGSGLAASIALHCPRVVKDTNGIPVLSDTYSPVWGATIPFSNYVRSGSSTPFNKIAFLRDPDSEASYIVTYQGSVGDIDPEVLINANTNRPTVICIQGAVDTKGFVFFTGASSLSSIQESFDTSLLDTALRSTC